MMKSLFKIGMVVGCLLMFTATLSPMILHAQFPASNDPQPVGPVAIGQQMLQKDDAHGGVALVQSAPPSGGRCRTG